MNEKVKERKNKDKKDGEIVCTVHVDKIRRERMRYAVRKIRQGKLFWVKYDYVTK